MQYASRRAVISQLRPLILTYNDGTRYRLGNISTLPITYKHQALKKITSLFPVYILGYFLYDKAHVVNVIRRLRKKIKILITSRMDIYFTFYCYITPGYLLHYILSDVTP